MLPVKYKASSYDWYSGIQIITQWIWSWGWNCSCVEYFEWCLDQFSVINPSKDDLKNNISILWSSIDFHVAPTIIFKDNAAEYIEADFKKFMRMGDSQEDFTKLEISAKPFMMVEDMKSVDKNCVTV